MIELKKKQKILVVRYSDFLIQNTMKLHIDLLKKEKSVWFGKIGIKPSLKTVDSIRKDNEYFVILHKRLESYLCRVSEISYKRPQNGYPDYYQEYFFDVGQELSVYFRITEISKLPKSYLEGFILASTGMPASSAINRSMSSIFTVEPIADLVFIETT
jgi:hypothetical protein